MKKQIKKALENLDTIVLCIRATGGYRFRKHIRLSDLELNQTCINAKLMLKKAVTSLIVAEEMLKEPDYWTGKDRWDEYQKRQVAAFQEASKELIK